MWPQMCFSGARTRHKELLGLGAVAADLQAKTVRLDANPHPPSTHPLVQLNSIVSCTEDV